MLDRIKTALLNENGGPQVETVIAIYVAIMVLIALGALGAAIIYWVAGATGSVKSLS